MRFLNVIIAWLIATPACLAPTRTSNTSVGARESALELDHFDVGGLDRSLDPCVNFYKYVCNKWIAANPIPLQEIDWGTRSKLQRWNDEALHGILEQVSGHRATSPDEQKIGDYYASCMDEKAIDAKGIAPVVSELARISALKEKSQLAEELAHLHRITFAMSGHSVSGYYTPLFGFASAPDPDDATKVVAIADQGGLGLPDRGYYFRRDPKSVETRKQYVDHVKKMFGLIGEEAERAATDAQAVLEMETAMANASMDIVKRRDPDNLNHKMSLVKLQALTPAFHWKEYLEGIRAPMTPHYIIVYAPGFFRALETLFTQQPLEHWKAYLRIHLLDTVSPLLSHPFVDENFDFYRRKLFGQELIEPRWHRCLTYTDRDLGEALGQVYVAHYFSPESKQRMLKLVAALKNALDSDIQQLNWMTSATKKEAEAKLHAMENRIGYPDRWRDYSRLQIVSGNAVGNAFRASEFELQRQLDKIGKPVDRSEWIMTPPIVNAYYDLQLNAINFPAGILQPPFFDPRMDDAVNYGAIGAVIGHEITHGFDDRGSKFDLQGNRRNWWTDQDFEEFHERTQCLVDEYSQFVATADFHLNGKLTLGENIADNAGLNVALIALLDTLARSGKTAEKVDGLTPEQRFFISFGESWCENATPQWLRFLAQADHHSPAMYRVNGVVSNMPEFQKAFGCKRGQPMVRINACRVW